MRATSKILCLIPYIFSPPLIRNLTNLNSFEIWTIIWNNLFLNVRLIIAFVSAFTFTFAFHLMNACSGENWLNPMYVVTDGEKPRKTEINYQSYQLLTKSFVFGSLENIFQKYVAWIIACRLRSRFLAYSFVGHRRSPQLPPSGNGCKACFVVGVSMNLHSHLMMERHTTVSRLNRAADFTAYVLIKCIFSNHIGIYYVCSINFVFDGDGKRGNETDR